MDADSELAALRSGNTKVVLENGKLLDRLQATRKALEECRTVYCGYAITKDDQYPTVVANLWKEIKRIDGIVRTTLAALETK